MAVTGCQGSLDALYRRVDLASLAGVSSLPAPTAEGPRILCVVAHPDDELAFGGLLYKTASFLGGHCDVAVLTNGEGGYKYATLAEGVYGLPLTQEAVGRAHLPAIRAREMAAGCALLGVRSIFHLGQTDHRYNTDPLEVLAADAGVWELDEVRRALDELLARGDYDFLLTLAPTETTHGHHQAATLLALEAVRRLPEEARPAALCVETSNPDEGASTFEGRPRYPLTRTVPHPDLVFDRTQPFGYRDRLDYRIVVNWAIAEHRSQGTMQLLVNRGEQEHYFLFAGGPADAVARCVSLFDALAAVQFEPLDYEAPATPSSLESTPR